MGILWKLYWDVIPTDKYGNTKHRRYTRETEMVDERMKSDVWGPLRRHSVSGYLEML